MSKILVIVPTYNEEGTIGELLDRLLKLDLELDILVVDDGDDLTGNIVNEKQRQHKNIYLIKRQSKSGRGTAVLEGLLFGLKQDYDYFVEMDADFSHPPEELPELMKLAEPNKVVIASRYIKGSRIENWPIRRRLFSHMANFYAKLVLGIPIHDYTTGYRVYGRTAIESLDFEKFKSAGYIVLSEIAYQLYKNGVQFAERKTVFVNRERGESSFSLQEVKEAFAAVWRIKKEFK
ncbi:MAG: dolichyl-phosphate beta-D-mannosyltransferase [Candidatus Buchananbacteria bacterium CG10_big_fil_rev_8_21_14_0_10_42_9]|uniref:Dolichyl-phosphate beta-D-mannosyltransferase n=1 Tax=Candidatus Buchananbacteria bacterium CG10_big_fil_rev_8_21_14_0_10_42_9 TaxID=1974526 RepID=A0A2H0W0H6_9BACT|nr:MAG: dolichyl-phosphate beta-D-mannosyltransferase [Candidatus Buchananbacteria bacterium CG10_big_fil_rev_8_21_14_0_10_42_9]